jgi:anti-anti-sigma factor
MNFQFREISGIQIVDAQGEIRISTQDEFKSCLDKLFSEYGHKVAVLDMKNVTYINSAGIGIIVDTFKNFRDNNGKLILSGLSCEIAKLFELTKLNRFIEIYCCVDDAIAKNML